MEENLFIFGTRSKSFSSVDIVWSTVTAAQDIGASFYMIKQATFLIVEAKSCQYLVELCVASYSDYMTTAKWAVVGKTTTKLAVIPISNARLFPVLRYSGTEG